MPEPELFFDFFNTRWLSSLHPTPPYSAAPAQQVEGRVWVCASSSAACCVPDQVGFRWRRLLGAQLLLCAQNWELRGLTAPRSSRSSTSRWSRSTQGAPPETAHAVRRPLRAPTTDLTNRLPKLSPRAPYLLLAPHLRRLLGFSVPTRLKVLRGFAPLATFCAAGYSSSHFGCEAVVTHRHRVRV